MSHADLAALFSQLADEELSARIASGGLTEEANGLAAAELRSRGLPVPETTPELVIANDEYLGDMIFLERSLDPTEAHLLCSCLRSAGIHATAGDTNIVQAHSLLAIAVGGAGVRVPSTQLLEAREIVAAFRRGEFELGDDFDPNETAA
ncbi:hypothetical protein [Piscinibacter defluvii]|uniref:hypothetical protein n=1 Tax=Piscinibacter defluvii TaxID=1796922 RepID=UPI000FDE5CFF|nr:hypothetical protein [Piscinibacter defluvii]